MFSFIGTAFLYLLPLVIFAVLMPMVPYKWLLIRFLTSLQFSLLFYSVYLVRQLIGLWQLASLMDFKQLAYQPSLVSMIPIFLLIILPFVFLFKGWLSKIWTGIVFWALLIYTNGIDTMITSPLALTIDILFYISMLITFYSLILLYKKFPDQSIS